MGLRRKSREFALKLLYRIDLTGEEWEELSRTLSDYGGSKSIHEYGSALVECVLNHQAEIDEILSSNAKNWSLNRMATLDRNILRIGLAEHLVLASAPPAVIINEAVDIATKFSTEHSGAFVNGVLDRILRLHSAGSLVSN